MSHKKSIDESKENAVVINQNTSETKSKLKDKQTENLVL